MRRPLLTALMILGLALVASAASAGNPFYFTGKLGSTTFDGDLDGAFIPVFDDGDETWSFGLGFKLGKRLAFQAEYHDLGNASGLFPACEECDVIPSTFETDSTVLSVTVLPSLPLGARFHLYGKFGLVSWESELSEISDAADRFVEDFDDEDVIYGAGLRFLLPGPFDVYGEYENIGDIFETIAVGATFGF